MSHEERSNPISREPMNEFKRIEKLTAVLQNSRGPNSKRVQIGIGDDAAVVESPKSRLLLCSDALVEKVHFDLSFTSPQQLGHKALASALSDLAAMNGIPRYALISIAIPKSTPNSFLEEFYEGVGLLAKRWDVDLVGGDLSASPNEIFIDVMAVGEANQPILRSTAQPGDYVAVSGKPGASAAGLFALQNKHFAEAEFEPLVKAHLEPNPRFDLLHSFSSNPGLCTSLIDISDGLTSELLHLAKESNVGFEVEENKIPLHEYAVKLAAKVNRNALSWALDGGEDYELLATFHPDLIQRLGGAPQGFTLIGRATTSNEGVRLIRNDKSVQKLTPSGYDHFR